MTWSGNARKRSHLARKVKYRFGTKAYNRFKKSGAIPRGLNSTLPRSRANRKKKYPQSGAKRRRRSTRKR